MFHQARIKLTIWYITIASLISVTFSVMIFLFISREIERIEQISRARMERRIIERMVLPPGFGTPRIPEILRLATPEVLEEARYRVFLVLTTVNGVVVILSGTLGYLLAGRTLHPIREMIDRQDRFVSDASHEIRTPLTSLKSAFEVYLRDSGRSRRDADQLAKESIVEVDKLQNLTEMLLTLTTLGAGSSRERFRSVDLTGLAVDALRQVQSLADARGIRLTTTENKPINLSGSEELLRQLIVILLENGVKYGRERGQVNIRLHRSGTSAILEVSDNGIGIPKRDVPHIFDRFYRADTSRGRNGRNGFGLGLAIAREIVRIHHGSIQVKSREGKGSAFTVTLPVRNST